MINQIKKRRSPALVISVLMLVYVWFFSYPEISRVFQHSRYALSVFEEGGVHSFLVLVELLCIIVTVATWVLSVFVTWVAYEKSKKKAYIFILAYFFLPLVAQPSGRVIQRFRNAHQIPEYQVKKTDVSRETTTPRMYARSRSVEGVQGIHIYFPVGPLLLLAGVWHLYRKEELECDEQITGDSLRVPRENLS